MTVSSNFEHRSYIFGLASGMRGTFLCVPYQLRGGIADSSPLSRRMCPCAAAGSVIGSLVFGFLPFSYFPAGIGVVSVLFLFMSIPAALYLPPTVEISRRPKYEGVLCVPCVCRAVCRAVCRVCAVSCAVSCAVRVCMCALARIMPCVQAPSQQSGWALPVPLLLVYFKFHTPQIGDGRRSGGRLGRSITLPRSTRSLPTASRRPIPVPAPLCPPWSSFPVRFARTKKN